MNGERQFACTEFLLQNPGSVFVRRYDKSCPGKKFSFKPFPETCQRNPGIHLWIEFMRMVYNRSAARPGGEQCRKKRRQIMCLIQITPVPASTPRSLDDKLYV
jgi:hypothetical protein